MIPRTRESLIEMLRKAKPQLEDRFNVAQVALFGSWARGEQRPESDVDVLVDVDPGLDFAILAETLEQLLDFL